MGIWTTNYLEQLAGDAEQQINQEGNFIYKRFCMATVAAQSLYTLPSFVRGVIRITWRGRKLDPVTWEELQQLTPATAAPYTDNQLRGRPLYYAMHPTNPYDIRFMPTPNESFDGSGDPFSPVTDGSTCIVSCWRNIDSTFTDPTALLPNYIDRRTRKAYVAWKAFESEGRGQDLQASMYYSQKFSFLIEQFKLINTGCYISKRYSLGDGRIEIDNFRYPRPMLPARFENERF